MQRGAAQRFESWPHGRGTLIAILEEPSWNIQINFDFPRGHLQPWRHIHAARLRALQRERAPVERSQARLYRDVSDDAAGITVKANRRRLSTGSQFRRVARNIPDPLSGPDGELRLHRGSKVPSCCRARSGTTAVEGFRIAMPPPSAQAALIPGPKSECSMSVITVTRRTRSRTAWRRASRCAGELGHPSGAECPATRARSPHTARGCRECDRSPLA